MEQLLEEYTNVASNNSMAKAVWNTVMRVGVLIARYFALPFLLPSPIGLKGVYIPFASSL